jgi:hypothetical protein
MLRDYDDIKTKLGDPIWYDDNGVPRYDPFKPDMCGVYDDQVVLLEIACQDCGKKFKVAECWDKHRAMWKAIENRNWIDINSIEPLPTKSGKWFYHYGDPPNHGCVGDTMNSEPIRVLEFWHKEDFKWVRDVSQEIEWESDDDRKEPTDG